MEKPEYLQSLEKDIQLFKESIREASESIIQDGISSYPVFIAHRIPFFMGEIILDKEELITEWSISATTAEELIRQGVIQVEKAKFFISNYKPAQEYMCLFVVPSEEEAHFIFIPY